MENQSGVVLNPMKHVLNLLQASEALSQTKIILSRNTVSDKSYQIERRLGFRQQNQSILYLLIGQWVIYWNDNKHPGNEIIFTAEAGFTKCPTEIEAKKWKFSFAWGRFIKSIKCA